MKPGRELDALVAEKVMGWVIGSDHISHDGIGFSRQYLDIALPRFSTDIFAAWKVVEKLHSLGFKIGVDAQTNSYSACVVATLEKGIYKVVANEVKETAPHAICLAALKAVGVEV